METVLSSKGQIVIPQKIRKNHGWRAGMKFSLTEEGNTLVLRPSGKQTTVTIDAVIGCAGYTGPRISIEEMETVIAEEAAKRTAS